MGIRRKLITILVIFALVGVGMFLVTIYVTSRNFFLETNLQLLQKDNRHYVYEVNNFFGDIKNDILTIASEVKFVSNGQSVLTEESARDIQNNFINIMEIHKFYSQLRYIDENGNEIIRVNYDRKTNAARVVPVSELQNKKDRPYFPETTKLAKGQYYVSPLDLNREGTPPTIMVPYTPVIRYAIPVFDDKNKQKGILIANVFAEDFLQFLLSTTQNQTTILLNAKGYYLLSPDKNKAWGDPADLNTGENYRKDYPKLADRVLSQKEGTIIEDDNIISYAPVLLGGSTKQTFILVTSLPQAVALAPTNAITGQVILYSIVLTVGIIIVFMIFARRFLAPLDTLASAAKKISEGDLSQKVVVSSNDEIGQVSKAFNEMVIKLKNLYQGLEEKIKERTKELTENVTKLEDTKRATLNLLEDLKEEKERTEEQKNLFSSLIDNSPIGVFVVKAPNGEAIIMNSIGAAIAGQKVDASINKERYSQIFHLVDENGAAYPNQDLPTSKALREGKTFAANDIFIQRPNGAKTALKVTSAPVFDEKGQVSMCVTLFEDITREKEIDKMKTDFVSIASHQLRSPLVAMKWLLEVLSSKETGALNTEQAELIQNMDSSNERMIDLVNVLLNVASIESGKLKVEPSPTDLVKFIEDIKKELNEQIQTNKQNFSVNIASDLSLVNIDDKLIREVYLNLLSNAIKYTPAGGEISLSIFAKDNELMSEITDNGCGIPERSKQDIFKKFFRAENVVRLSPHGNGLGLYLAKSIVEASGGKIGFRSVEGKGTTFWFSLPLSGALAIQQ